MNKRKYLPLVLAGARILSTPLTLGSGTLPPIADTRVEMQDFENGKLVFAGVVAKVVIAPGQTDYAMTDFEDGTVMFKDVCTREFVTLSRDHKEIQHDAPIRCSQLPKSGSMLETKDAN